MFFALRFHIEKQDYFYSSFSILHSSFWTFFILNILHFVPNSLNFKRLRHFPIYMQQNSFDVACIFYSFADENQNY